jgi:hypothetical protein
MLVFITGMAWPPIISLAIGRWVIPRPPFGAPQELTDLALHILASPRPTALEDAEEDATPEEARHPIFKRLYWRITLILALIGVVQWVSIFVGLTFFYTDDSELNLFKLIIPLSLVGGALPCMLLMCYVDRRKLKRVLEPDTYGDSSNTLPTVL